MTPKDGFKRIKKLLGPTAHYREYSWRSSPEARAKATEDRTRLKAEYDAAKLARDERQRVLLADPEFQRLSAQTRTLRAQYEEAQGLALRYRIHVGRNNGMFFHVTASGDNWADVVRQIEEMKNP